MSSRLVLQVMTPEDLAALRKAVQSLEHPGLAARLTNMVGKPIEIMAHVLPASASQVIATATTKGLEVALKVALRTMQRHPLAGSQLIHKALATVSGAVGGTFGLATLPIELPVSTIIMLRSIADIAQSAREDLSDPETALSCVQVFALGGRAGSADVSESGYFATRGMLAKSVTEAARFIAERGILKEGGPVLVRFITQVAARFGVVVTQKVAAQAVPVVGALGGAAVNYVFIEHFQEVARGHFTVRRLERVYGKDSSGPNMNALLSKRSPDLSERNPGQPVPERPPSGASVLKTKLDDRSVSSMSGSDGVRTTLQEKACQSARPVVASDDFVNRGSLLLQRQRIPLIGQPHVKIEFIKRRFDNDWTLNIAMVTNALACLHRNENDAFNDIASCAPPRSLLIEKSSNRLMDVGIRSKSNFLPTREPNAKQCIQQQGGKDAYRKVRADERLQIVRKAQVKIRKNITTETQDQRNANNERFSCIQQSTGDDLKSAAQDEARIEDKRCP